MNALRDPHGTDLAAVLELLRSKYPASNLALAQNFVTSCGAEVAPAEWGERSPSAWAALFADLFTFVKSRPAGRTLVRAFNPGMDANGWEDPCSVLQIVTDDMPFLVDTVSMARAGAGCRSTR